MSESGSLWEWVTIGEAGPYKVLANGDHNMIWIRYVDRTMEVPSEWCEKVEPPWKPKSLTLWTDRRHEGVWEVLSDGRVRLLDSMDTVLDAEYVQRTYGPMTQLVPKGQTDEVEPWIRAYMAD